MRAKPFKTVNGLSRTYFYFYTLAEAEAWVNVSQYQSTVSKVSEKVYEVTEHYYNLKAIAKAAE